MNDDDWLVGEVDARICLGESGIIPRRNLAQKYISEQLRRKFQLFGDAGNVICRNVSPEDGRDVQDLSFGLTQLLVCHRAIGSAEINRARQDLANSASAADGLVVELNIGMQLVIFAEPFGI